MAVRSPLSDLRQTSRPTARGLALAAFAAFAAFAAAAVATACGSKDAEEAAEPPQRLTHVRLTGELDVGSQALLSRAVRTARDEHAAGLLIDIDTPGGEIELMWDLQRELLDAEEDGLRLVAWVHDHAASAGALIALSCERLYMSPSGTIGSAYPVMAGPEGVQALPEEDGVREKTLSFLRAQFGSMAERRGRSPDLAQAMVDPAVEVRQVRVDGELVLLGADAWDTLRDGGKDYELVQTVSTSGSLLNLTARQAVEFGFADGIASSAAQVLDRLGFPPADPTRAVLERSAAENTVAWIVRLTPLLIFAGLVLGYIELKMPGFGVPGILSLACFGAVVAGKYLAGMAEVPHIVAIALGLVLVALEVLAFPGTLWLGLTGGVLAAGGLVMASLGGGYQLSEPWARERLLDVGLGYALAAVAAVIAALVISRWLPNVPILRRAVLAPAGPGFAGALPEHDALPAAGALGRALTDLRPVGKVEVDGRAGVEYEARSQDNLLPRGARVRVIEVAAGRLVVESAEDQA